MKTKMSIIAAFDKNNGVGINNTLPWNLSKDLIRFKAITQHNPIVMGRKTFESIGKPLPNRINIVLSRDKNWALSMKKAHKGLIVLSSWEDLETWISEFTPEHIYIIGGPQIWKEALPFTHQLLLTKIEKEYECDAFFPQLKESDWVKSDEIIYTDYAFVNYIKKEKSFISVIKETKVSTEYIEIAIKDLMQYSVSDKLDAYEKIRFSAIKENAYIHISLKQNEALSFEKDIKFNYDNETEKKWFIERFPQYISKLNT